MEFSMERFTSSLWSILCLGVSLEFLAILIARRPKTKLGDIDACFFLLIYFLRLADSGNVSLERVGNS
jgi:hypothetical protein